MRTEALARLEQRLKELSIYEQNYRSFLLSYFMVLKELKLPYGYASFARKADLKSRSFPREVITGRRNLSQSSLRKFESAMNLKGDTSMVFRLLVFQEHIELAPVKSTEKSIAKDLDRARERIRKAGFAQGMLLTDDLTSRLAFRFAYAALDEGVSENDGGTSIEEVRSKVGMGAYQCRRVVEKMCDDGIIGWNSSRDRFFLKDRHPIFHSLKQDENRFQDFYEVVLKSFGRLANEDMAQSEALFFSSSVSVNSRDLPQLKDELRDLVTRYADQIEDASGDTIVNISLGMARSSEIIRMVE
ncbi:hypothetical protein COB52_05410 [Candidatus Kaiserbacteria bacterium]|nr:MAG: hypothetical protein COB52_05410 [Candidatus Kaiserbacteria bacterium]